MLSLEANRVIAWPTGVGATFPNLPHTSTANRGRLPVLDVSLATFQRLEHSFLKRCELGGCFVQRSSGTLLGCIHEPLCLVFRFECHGLQWGLSQKLHTQNRRVFKAMRPSLKGTSAHSHHDNRSLGPAPVETGGELVPSSQMNSSHSTDFLRDLPSLSAAHCVQLCSQPTRVLQNHARTMDKRKSNRSLEGLQRNERAAIC